ncbi:MAG: S46 family peptidase [Flavobacteriales bacterium]
MCLVGAQPSYIEKCDGDINNWEWSSYIGDSSAFKVYVDKDGNPADYSPDNVSLKPKHFLLANLKPPPTR